MPTPGGRPATVPRVVTPVAGVPVIKLPDPATPQPLKRTPTSVRGSPALVPRAQTFGGPQVVPPRSQTPPPGVPAQSPAAGSQAVPRAQTPVAPAPGSGSQAV